MSLEFLMPSRYEGKNCGISAIVFGLDENVNYNKILIYLKDNKESAIEVVRNSYHTLQTKEATFDDLDEHKYYQIAAELYYDDGTVKTIESKMPTKVNTDSDISLDSSSSEGGNAGGKPTGGEVEKPAKFYPPTTYGQINPIYTNIKNQNPYQSCVANSLSTAMSIFRLMESDIMEDYSVAYIFGSDGRSVENMIFEEAVDLCIQYGSPRWELYRGLFNDSTYKNTAVSLFNNAQSDKIIVNNAYKQRFKRKYRINFYDCDSVAEYIDAHGYFMFNFKIPNNFYSVGSNGIVPQPDTYSGENHSIALIGLTKISGNWYWIAQNSWGDTWGKDGRCFIPCDWGYDSSQYWALDSYGIVPGNGFSGDQPSAVYDLVAEQDGNEKQVYLSWNSDESNADYVVLARQYGTEQWYRKAITTDTTAIVSVDNFAKYDFMVLTLKDYYCSPQSKIVCVTVIDTLHSLVISRSDDTLNLSWSGGSGAVKYWAQVINCDTGEITRQSSKVRECSFVALDNGTTYIVSVQAQYNNDVMSELMFNKLVTILPAAPVITLTQIDTSIKVDYRTLYSTYMTYFLFSLWDGDNKNCLESDITIDTGSEFKKHPGSFTFNTQCEEGKTYCVRANTVLHTDSEILYNSTDTGGDGYICTYITIKEPDLIPTDFTISRRLYGITILQWSGAEDATGFNVKITRNYDGHSYVKEGITNRIFEMRSYKLTNWEYGVSYTVSVQAYNDWKIGEWVSISPVTTNPARAILTLSQYNEMIGVNYKFQYTTNITRLICVLYEGDYQDDNFDRNANLIEVKTIQIEPGDQNPSGKFQFEHQCEIGKVYSVSRYEEIDLMIPDYDGVKLLSNTNDMSKKITINETYLTPTNLRVRSRSDKFVMLQWNDAESATGFNVKFTRHYDGYSYINEGITGRMSGFYAKDYEDWGYGVTYTASVQAYNDWGEGDWISLSPVTTYPAQAILILSQNNQKIVVDYEFEHTTNVTRLICGLYKGVREDDDFDASADPIEIKTIYIESGDQNPSGRFQFEHQCEEGSYTISCIEELDLVVPEYTNGNEHYKLVNSSRYDGAVITITTSKPLPWEWTSSMKGQLTVDANKEVHPVTAVEWNEFTARINAMREYRGVSAYNFTVVSGASSGSPNNRTEFTPGIYNEAVYAIQGIGDGAGGLLNTISNTTQLSASLFIILQEELNAAINNL